MHLLSRPCCHEAQLLVHLYFGFQDFMDSVLVRHPHQVTSEILQAFRSFFCNSHIPNHEIFLLKAH